MQEKEKVALFLCQAKREHSRLVPQKLSHPALGNRERFYIPVKILLFFFSFAKFQNSHSWHQSTQQPRLVSLKLLAHDLFKI